MTATVIVPTVTRVKTAATSTTKPTFASDAGYISTGISGSHGPNRKMVNSTQGVMPLAFAGGIEVVSAPGPSLEPLDTGTCACRCSPWWTCSC